jgi:hypothetical protein
MAVAVLGHPFRALEVQLPTTAGTIGLGGRITAQDDPRSLAPIGTL